MSEVISLDAYRRAAATPDEPLDEPSPIAAILGDWSAALEASGGEVTLAHLYSMAELLEVIAEADNPADAAVGTVATIYEEIARMARARRRG